MGGRHVGGGRGKASHVSGRGGRRAAELLRGRQGVNKSKRTPVIKVIMMVDKAIGMPN